MITDPNLKKRIDIIQETRECYLKAESDEKIRLALPHKAIQSQDRDWGRSNVLSGWS